MAHRRSKTASYHHCVWTTDRRADLLVGTIERAAYRVIVAEAERLKCKVIAIGGVADHVHLLVRMHPDVSLAGLMKQVKGVSSAHINASRPEYQERFRWQAGYAAFSLSSVHLRAAAAYVNRQKQHHVAERLWPEWEQTDEPALD